MSSLGALAAIMDDYENEEEEDCKSSVVEADEKHKEEFGEDAQGEEKGEEKARGPENPADASTSDGGGGGDGVDVELETSAKGQCQGTKKEQTISTVPSSEEKQPHPFIVDSAPCPSTSAAFTEPQASSASSSSESDSESDSESSSSSSAAEEEEEEVTEGKSRGQQPPKGKKKYSYADEPEFLPKIEELRISVPEAECIELGHVHAIVGDQVVVRGLPQKPAVDLDSVLFLDKGERALGKVFDVFGPVNAPFYSVRFDPILYPPLFACLMYPCLCSM